MLKGINNNKRQSHESVRVVRAWLDINKNGIGEGLAQGKGENTVAGTPVTAYRFVGDKQYELTNHLGNVLSVVSDRKLIDKNIFMPDVLSYSDYYPFGMLVLIMQCIGSKCYIWKL